MEQQSLVKKVKAHKGLIIFVIIAVAGAYYFGSLRNNTSPVAAPDQQSFENSSPPSPGTAPVYDYTEVAGHIGEYASVKGTVVKIVTSKTNTTFFDYCYDYRNCPFSAVIFSSAKSRFSDLGQYQGQKITVKGQIKSYQGKAEIILNDPSQITN